MEKRVTPGVLSVVAATGQHLIRLDDGMYLKREGVLSRLPDGTSMDALLRRPLDELRRFLGQDRPAASLRDGAVLEAPIQSQEVWAAGVTYQRSLEARADEAVSSDPYDRVYTAQRPELFFKATAGKARIRSTCRRRRCSTDAARLGPRWLWRGTFRRRIARSSWRYAGTAPWSSD